jgi:hypothetical protein
MHRIFLIISWDYQERMWGRGKGQTRRLPPFRILFVLGWGETGSTWWHPRLKVDEYGAFGGMRIGRGNRSRILVEKLPQCHFVHHKSHKSWFWACAIGAQRPTALALERSTITGSIEQKLNIYQILITKNVLLFLELYSAVLGPSSKVVWTA